MFIFSLSSIFCETLFIHALIYDNEAQFPALHFFHKKELLTENNLNEFEVTDTKKVRYVNISIIYILLFNLGTIQCQVISFSLLATHESPCSKNMKQYKHLTFNQLTDNDILKYLKLYFTI